MDPHAAAGGDKPAADSSKPATDNLDDLDGEADGDLKK